MLKHTLKFLMCLILIYVTDSVPPFVRECWHTYEGQYLYESYLGIFQFIIFITIWFFFLFNWQVIISQQYIIYICPVFWPLDYLVILFKFVHFRTTMAMIYCVVILQFTILAYLTNANDEFCTKANDCQVSVTQLFIVNKR